MKRFLLCSVAAAGLALASPASADTFLAVDYNVIGGKSVSSMVSTSPLTRRSLRTCNLA